MEDKQENQEIENVAENLERVETQEISSEEKRESAESLDNEGKVTESKPKSKKKKEKVKKEKVEESYEGLSDDEIYTKLQTEKLLKRKKKKRIITSVAMGVAFAIAVVIIVLATVPVSLKPRCIGDDYTTVRFYNGTSLSGAEASFDADDDRFAQFEEVFDDSFGQSYLTALFSGSLFASSYEPEEKHQTFQTVANELITNNTYFVRLSYSEPKTLTYQNGRTYISLYANSNFDGVFTFTDIYIAVNNEDGFRDTKVYIPVYYPSEEGEFAITITVRANTYKIYEVWNDFVNE